MKIFPTSARQISDLCQAPNFAEQRHDSAFGWSEARVSLRLNILHQINFLVPCPGGNPVLVRRSAREENAKASLGKACEHGAAENERKYSVAAKVSSGTDNSFITCDLRQILDPISKSLAFLATFSSFTLHKVIAGQWPAAADDDARSLCGINFRFCRSAPISRQHWQRK